MIPLLLLIAAGLGLVLVSDSETMTRAPGKAKPLAPLPDFATPARDGKEAQARFALLKTLRPDAREGISDWYRRHGFQIVQAKMPGEWGGYKNYTPDEIANFNAGKKYPHTLEVSDLYSVGLYDEYGRVIPGVSGNPLGAVLAVVGYAAPFIPGVGPAASAALAAAVALGQGKSLKEAALAAARAALPLGATPAFDLGVALASGESVDDAAKDALLAYIPGGNEAFQKGEAMYTMLKGVGR